jgi:sigma-B regulation protein RsbU (phosphoserine phosphatase)
MEGVRYRINEITLNAGERIFLYTDGVTEATNENNELYGEDRLLSFMNKSLELDQTKLLPKLKKDIDIFVGKAPQFDDITMLCLEYKTKMEIKEEDAQ